MAYRKSNFITRIIAAVILAPLVLFAIKLSGFYFTSIVLIAAIIMGGEWFNMTKEKSNLWKAAGVFYILIPCISLLWIIQQTHIFNGTVRFNGVNTVISIFVLVWANDIGGYVFGKLLGGKKLCPAVSPNKTWSGFFGGIILAVVVSPIVRENMAIAGIVAIIASLGDLLESWMKRCCDVKDSGSIIPGHGGFLDRLDGVMLVSVVVAASALYNQ